MVAQPTRIPLVPTCAVKFSRRGCLWHGSDAGLDGWGKGHRAARAGVVLDRALRRQPLQ